MLLDISTSAPSNWFQILTLIGVIILLVLALWGHWRP